MGVIIGFEPTSSLVDVRSSTLITPISLYCHFTKSSAYLFDFQSIRNIILSCVFIGIKTLTNKGKIYVATIYKIFATYSNNVHYCLKSAMCSERASCYWSHEVFPAAALSIIVPLKPAANKPHGNALGARLSHSRGSRSFYIDYAMKIDTLYPSFAAFDVFGYHTRSTYDRNYVLADGKICNQINNKCFTENLIYRSHSMVRRTLKSSEQIL